MILHIYLNETLHIWGPVNNILYLLSSNPVERFQSYAARDENVYFVTDESSVGRLTSDLPEGLISERPGQSRDCPLASTQLQSLCHLGRVGQKLSAVQVADADEKQPEGTEPGTPSINMFLLHGTVAKGYLPALFPLNPPNLTVKPVISCRNVVPYHQGPTVSIHTTRAILPRQNMKVSVHCETKLGKKACHLFLTNVVSKSPRHCSDLEIRMPAIT